MNVPAPHEYEGMFIEKRNAGQYDQMTILDQSEKWIAINVMTFVIVNTCINERFRN